jgi:hypothetical protein
MAIVWLQTPFQDEKIWTATYQGRGARLCLAVNSGSLSAGSTTAQWDAAEISGNGYARYQWTLAAGSYNSISARYEVPPQLCSFQASTNGVGLTWNTAYIVLGTISGNSTTWDTAPAFLLVESPNVVLYPGEPRSYSMEFFTDGFVVS